MSRDIGLTFRSSAIGRALWFVAPVALVGLDQVEGEDFAGGRVSGGDVVLVGAGEDTRLG
jgi:hypothetical protein